MNEVSLKSTKAVLFEEVCNLRESVTSTANALYVVNNNYRDLIANRFKLESNIKTLENISKSKTITIDSLNSIIAKLEKTVNDLNDELENEKLNNVKILNSKNFIIEGNNSLIALLTSKSNIYKAAIKKYKIAVIIISIVAIAVCIY